MLEKNVRFRLSTYMSIINIISLRMVDKLNCSSSKTILDLLTLL